MKVYYLYIKREIISDRERLTDRQRQRDREKGRHCITEFLLLKFIYGPYSKSLLCKELIFAFPPIFYPLDETSSNKKGEILDVYTFLFAAIVFKF